MNIQKTCKIELCASSDATRYAISEPYLDITDGKGSLVATDGRRLVVIPVEVDEKDVAGYVSGEVLRAARKATKSKTAKIEVNGVAVLENGITMPRAGAAQKDATYPKWRQVVPKDEIPVTVCLNARWLYEIAQGMGSEIVQLKIRSAIDSIMVMPGQGGAPGAHAVLMPVRTT